MRTVDVDVAQQGLLQADRKAAQVDRAVGRRTDIAQVLQRRVRQEQLLGGVVAVTIAKAAKDGRAGAGAPQGVEDRLCVLWVQRAVLVRVERLHERGSKRGGGGRRE